MKFLTEADEKFVAFIKFETNCVCHMPISDVQRLIEIIKKQNLALEKAIKQRDFYIYENFFDSPTTKFENEDERNAEIAAIMNEEVK